MNRKKSNNSYSYLNNWIDIYHLTTNAELKSNIKARIVSEMVPVIRNIATTIARRHYDPIDDLVQAGFIGLLKSIETFSKEKNDNFRVYAGYFIIGEIKHYLRDKLNAIRVPRHIQELSIRINNFTKNLTYEEIQKLTSEDVAAALDIPVKDVDFVLEIERRSTVVSFESMFNESDGLSYEELITGKGYKEKASLEDLKMMLDDIINLLPPTEKIVIDMYYYQDMSQNEIAKSLGVTKMKISRDMKRAFKMLYKLIKEKAATDKDFDIHFERIKDGLSES